MDPNIIAVLKNNDRLDRLFEYRRDLIRRVVMQPIRRYSYDAYAFVGNSDPVPHVFYSQQEEA